MQRLYVYVIFVILFGCSTAFSQIWFVKNVSNVSLDDCFVSFGNNSGISYCFPERYVEPEKLAEWNDSAFYYILYPVYTFDIENDATAKKKHSVRRRKRRSGAHHDTDGGQQAHQPPTRIYNSEDSLAILELGSILYTYNDLLIYETFTPLQESDYSSYRPFQLLKPTPLKRVQQPSEK